MDLKQPVQPTTLPPKLLITKKNNNNKYIYNA